mgnify:CR=1 FL=1
MYNTSFKITCLFDMSVYVLSMIIIEWLILCLNIIILMLMRINYLSMDSDYSILQMNFHLDYHYA